MTATWTILEDSTDIYPATYATHTYTLTSSEFTNAIGATSVQLSPPTFSVKYSVSQAGSMARNGIHNFMSFDVSAGDVSLGVASTGVGTFATRLAANTTKTATGVWGTSSVALSSLFTANNPTERSIEIKWRPRSNSSEPLGYMYYAARTGAWDAGGGFTVISYRQDPPLAVLFNTYKEGSIKLNAPPTFDVSAISKDTSEYIAGITTVSVTVSNATAQYGGNITGVTLTIGSQSESISGNGTISIDLDSAYPNGVTPTVTVTDSRGQTTTQNLEQITVLPYENPTVSFGVVRTDSTGVKADEGHNGLITAKFTYMDSISSLDEPQVFIDGDAASATWYTGLTSAGAVDTATEIDGVNITWADIARGSTVYGLIGGNFSEGQSYLIGLQAVDSRTKTSQTITQTLPQAFYTIDFQAGGKEIAFGAPANDDLTDINGTDYSDEGLFKCAMGTSFNDMDQDELDDFIDDLNVGGAPIELTQVDWIVEQGTDGIWTYRKWQSGIAECWGNTGIVTVLNYNTYNNMYGYMYEVAFPQDLFSSVPVVAYSAYVGNGFALTGSINTGGYSTTSFRMYALGSASGSQPTRWVIEAKGRWK